MDTLLIRLRRFGVRIPRILWHRLVAAEARRSGKRLEWFAADHHAVRDFAVTEIARTGSPVPPDRIAAATGVADERLPAVLDELERGMTFLYRSGGEAVDWAYPMAAAATGHRIRLDSGERFFAA
jgi:hypothetical protein